MSDQPQNDDSAPQDPEGAPQLSDAEREMLEQQMKEIRVEDLLTQTVASVLNLTARRIVKEDEVDLDQARIGIDAVRAIVGLLPAEVGDAIREPLSQVQLLYAQRSGQGQDAGDSGAQEAPGGERKDPPPGQGPSKLWTPGGN